MDDNTKTQQLKLMNPCLSIAKQTFGMSEDQAEEFILDMVSEYDKFRKNKHDFKITFEEVIRENSAELKYQAKQKRLAAKLNPIKRRSMIEKIFMDGSDAKNVSRRLLYAITGGTQFGSGKGVRIGESVAAEQLADFKTLFGQVVKSSGLSRREWFATLAPPVFYDNPFTKKATAQAIRRKAFAEKLTTEMFGPNGEGFDLNNPVQHTDDAVAFRMAKSIVQAKKKLVDELISLGVPIKWLPGHVTSQYHDSLKIGEFSGETADKWIDEIWPLLNHERTFGSSMNDDEKTMMLRKIYKNIVEGKRPVDDMTGETQLVKGKKSIGNLISQHRVLHFKNPQAWIRYNEKFGHEDPIQGIIQGLKNLNDSTVLIRNFGTNPDDAFERIIQHVKERFPEKNVDIPQARAAWAQVTGEAYRVEWGRGSVNQYRYMQNVKAVINMSSLGSTLIPSMSDVPFAIGGLRHKGMGFFSAAHKQIQYQTKSLLGNLSDQERNEVVRAIGVGLDGFLGSMHSRVSADDPQPGTISRMQDFFFRMNGLARWTDSAREGFGMAMSNWTAQQLKHPWAKLDKSFKNSLEQYGLDEGAWDMMRRAGAKKINGEIYFTPDLLDNLKEGMPDLELSQFNEIDQVKRRLGQYFVEETNNAIIEVGPGERRFMYRNLQPGTPMHTLASLFWQFKSFPIAYGRRVFPRYAQMGLGYTLSQFGALSLVGYTALSMKELLKGREIPDPLDPKTAMQAFIYSGAGGLFADLLFNDARQYGRGPTDLLGGPSVSLFTDAVQLGSAFGVSAYDLATGDLPSAAKNAKDGLSRSFFLTYRNTPFINHFAVRTMADYMVLYPVMHYLNPGSVRDMEMRQKREQGIEYLPGMRPSETVR